MRGLGQGVVMRQDTQVGATPPAAAPGNAAIREARRRQLIDATITAISRSGLSGATLAAVTQIAKLSHGTVNFHFDSKEALYDATLGFLAREHYDLWHGAMIAAGPDPVRQLRAIVEADFHHSVCSPKKLAVWFAFWGQAKYRPNYLRIHHQHDDERFVQIRRLCAEIVREGGYGGRDPEVVARNLEALIDGVWLTLLLYPKAATRRRALADVMAFLATTFPRHFCEACMDTR